MFMFVRDRRRKYLHKSTSPSLSFFNLSPNLFDWLSFYLCLLLFVCELTSWGRSERLKRTVQESFHVSACILCDISRGRIQCNLENIIDLDSSEMRGHIWERREEIYSDASLDSSLLISSCIFRLFLQLWAILSLWTNSLKINTLHILTSLICLSNNVQQ